MIRLTDIAKSYPHRGGRKNVLLDVTTEFPMGRNSAILGPNGAGKSTLMRLISGAELPDRGNIDRFGSVSWPLGFAGGLHGSLSGRENVAFIARVYGRDYREVLEFVEDFADIGNAMRNPVKTYSSGMKARVAFGMSMALKFDYYLIDEVIAVGDAAFKRKCKSVMDERLKASTVILISHSPDLIRDFCNYGYVIRDGKLAQFEDLNEAIRFHEKP